MFGVQKCFFFIFFVSHFMFFLRGLYEQMTLLWIDYGSR